MAISSNRIADRVKEISSEPFRLALGLPKNVIRLTGGEPDFDTPAFVREAAKKAIDEGYTHYSPTVGYPELRKSVANKLSKENRVEYDYEKEVLITPGSSSGIFLALLALLNAGDEVIVADPAWFHYMTLVRLSGGKPVSVSVRVGETPPFDLEEFKRKITPRTKALILNSPSNPTGMVLSRDDVRALGELAEKHDLTVISDEVYEKIVYSGNVHTSPASLPNMKDRTVTSNGFSKGYAMTGWRVGYLAAPSEIVEKAAALSGYILVCPSSVSQQAAYAALTDSRMHDEIREMASQFAGRREMVLRALAGLPKIKVYPPQGTFYTWVDISRTGLSSEQFVYKLLESEQVGILPGNLFGARGEGHVRLSFATAEDQLKEGLQRLRRFSMKIASS